MKVMVALPCPELSAIDNSKIEKLRQQLAELEPCNRITYKDN